jgi:hypothetical protein
MTEENINELTKELDKIQLNDKYFETYDIKGLSKKIKNAKKIICMTGTTNLI